MYQFQQLLPYIQIIVAGLLITVILLQKGKAAMGSSFGQSGEFSSTRRGPEKHLFTSTIVLGVVFILLALVNLFLYQ